jgi:septal ring factor EnvC (AmiA/AmiB activator)
MWFFVSKKDFKKLDKKVNSVIKEHFKLVNLEDDSAVKERLDNLEKQMYFNKDNKLSSKFSELQKGINANKSWKRYLLKRIELQEKQINELESKLKELETDESMESNRESD